MKKKQADRTRLQADKLKSTGSTAKKAKAPAKKGEKRALATKGASSPGSGKKPKKESAFDRAQRKGRGSSSSSSSSSSSRAADDAILASAGLAQAAPSRPSPAKVKAPARKTKPVAKRTPAKSPAAKSPGSGRKSPAVKEAVRKQQEAQKARNRAQALQLMQNNNESVGQRRKPKAVVKEEWAVASDDEDGKDGKDVDAAPSIPTPAAHPASSSTGPTSFLNARTVVLVVVLAVAGYLLGHFKPYASTTLSLSAPEGSGGEDYYKLLQIDRAKVQKCADEKCVQGLVKKGRQQAMKVYHPDKVVGGHGKKCGADSNDPICKKNAVAALRVQEAHDSLKSWTSRHIYDLTYDQVRGV